MDNPYKDLQILIVDDREGNLEALEQELVYGDLKISRNNIRKALNVPEALNAMSGWKPNLVITDYRMPGMTGIELTHQIRRTYDKESVAVIVITGNADGYGVVQEAETAGANKALVRSTSFEELVQEIRNIYETGSFLAAEPGEPEP